MFVGACRGRTSAAWPAFVVPVWAILAAMGLVIPNAPAVALSRHPDAAGTAAALLGAAQFGLGAAVAPLVGVLGNDELALAAVMTVVRVVALLALLAVGVSAGDDATETVSDDGVGRTRVVVADVNDPYRRGELRPRGRSCRQYGLFVSSGRPVNTDAGHMAAKSLENSPVAVASARDLPIPSMQAGTWAPERARRVGI